VRQRLAQQQSERGSLECAKVSPFEQSTSGREQRAFHHRLQHTAQAQCLIGRDQVQCGSQRRHAHHRASFEQPRELRRREAFEPGQQRQVGRFGGLRLQAHQMP
jgi:hypothetical protein